MIDITAVVTTAPDEPFVLKKARLAELRDDEVLVRIAGVGVCHTDLAVKGAGFLAPGVLGHEGAGVVEEVGSGVTKLAPGDHVVLSYFACRSCPRCNAGEVAYCEHFAEANVSGTRQDGSSLIYIDGKPVKGAFFSQSSFATHAIARESNAVKVPADLPIELLGPLGCGFQTGAGTVLSVLDVKENEAIAIFGAGAVGLSAVMAARAVGAHPIVVVDLIGEKLETARRLGATDTIKSDETDVSEELRRVFPDGFAHAVECTGVPKLLEIAVEALRPAGVCALVGVGKPEATATISMATLLQGRTVKGVIEGEADPQAFIPHLVDLYREGRFPFDTLIRTYPMSEINNAVEDMVHGRTVKPVLLPG